MSLLGIARPSGRHRAVDEVARLRSQMFPLLVLVCWLMGRLREANAKVSYLGEIEARLAEATQRADNLEAEVTALRSQLANVRKRGDLGQHPAVAETQPIPVVVPLHLSPLAGVSPSHTPGGAP